jgi:hypothetical protein
VIDLLADLSIQAAARGDAPGVYVDGAKIASLGLRVRHGCSYHGVALNLDVDLAPFARINPCGPTGGSRSSTSATTPPSSRWSTASSASDRLQRLHLQLQGPAQASSKAQGLPLLLARRHRGGAQGLARLGRGLRRALPRHVRLRDPRARQRPAGAGARPARHQAAVLRRAAGGCASPRPAGAARRRRRRHRHRPGGPAPLHELPRRGAGAAHHPERRAQAAAGDGDDVIEPTARRPPSTGSSPSAAPRRGCASRTGSERCILASCARRSSAAGRRRAGRRAAVRRARFEPDRRRCWPSRASAGLNTFSVGFETVGGEVGDEFQYSDIIAERFGTEHHKIFVDSASRCCRAAQLHARHVRADGQPRRHRLLSAVQRSPSTSRWCRAARAPTRSSPAITGIRRCSAANDPVGDYARAFFDRDHDEFGRGRPALPRRGHSRAFVAAHFRAARRRAPVDKALRLDTRSCWSTIRSSGSTT